MLSVASYFLALSLLFDTYLCTPVKPSSPYSDVILRQRACDNSASDRSCWGEYDISTDYYNEVPDTGNTVTYWLDITNTSASPDGVERPALLVNGSLPGPTIEAKWGDTVTVHVTNSMQTNGSSIHWHGIRQNYTNMMDGVASITQCPIAVMCLALLHCISVLTTVARRDLYIYLAGDTVWYILVPLALGAPGMGRSFWWHCNQWPSDEQLRRRSRRAFSHQLVSSDRRCTIFVRPDRWTTNTGQRAHQRHECL